MFSSAILYEVPFPDTTPLGPAGLFSAQQVDDLVEIFRGIQANGYGSLPTGT